MTWNVTFSSGFSYDLINIDYKMKDQKYICQDCKAKLNQSEIVQHPDFEEGWDKEVWGDSCPYCLGEVQKLEVIHSLLDQNTKLRKAMEYEINKNYQRAETYQNMIDQEMMSGNENSANAAKLRGKLSMANLFIEDLKIILNQK